MEPPDERTKGYHFLSPVKAFTTVYKMILRKDKTAVRVLVSPLSIEVKCWIAANISLSSMRHIYLVKTFARAHKDISRTKHKSNKQETKPYIYLLCVWTNVRLEYLLSNAVHYCRHTPGKKLNPFIYLHLPLSVCVTWNFIFLVRQCL